MLDDWEHRSIVSTVLDGVPSVCLTKYIYFLRNVTVFSIHSAKIFTYLHDLPCQPGFNNSLDYGD